MKKIFTSLLLFVASLTLSAQGWPANYDGVMLQGFYWDSYSDTKWTNLESQADELSQYFNLIWVPQSGYCNSLSNQMGYSDIWWLDHKSAFGTEDELRSMIQTFKNKKVGIIADVVINHKNGNTNWCDFPNESKNGYKLTWDNTNLSGICQDDECKDNGYNPTGAKDTGINFDGCRDLDHTNATVQQNIKTYLDFLLKDLGYTGFRYDMVGGYAPKYTGIYNTSAKPEFSVGEYWMDDGKDGLVNWINGTKVDGDIQSAAFDFTMKWNINDAFSNGGNWNKLNNTALSNDPDYVRYAVTFVDNHDTGRSGAQPLYANIEAANAFILTMPGTPCVWLKHWLTYKTAIKKQIVVRKAAGVNNQSEILSHEASANGYVLTVKGTKGNVLLVLGSETAATTGYKLAVEGTNYKMYVSNSVDISALDDIQEDTFTAPDCCQVGDGEICAFFEAPTSYTAVKCYAWNGSTKYAGEWPGQACTKVGTVNGNNVWKWTYSGTLTELPSNIIFNGTGFDQTSDLDFKNGGYYSVSGAIQGVVTAINAIRHTPVVATSQAYDMLGRKVEPTTLRKGTIYIQNGKKYLKN